jgi:hypothetical protein
VTEPITRVTLFVPGAPASESAWNLALQRGGLRIERGALRGDILDATVGVEWVENDGQFGKAFSFGTVGPDVIGAVEAAPGALVLQWSVDLREGRKQIIAVVDRLRDAGALAVRLEQSKLGWGVARWLESRPMTSGRGTAQRLHFSGAKERCNRAACTRSPCLTCE